MTDASAQTRRMQALVSELWRVEGPGVEDHVGDVAWQRTMHVGREPEWRIREWDDVAWVWLRLPATLGYEIHQEHRAGPLHDELLSWFEAEAEGDVLRTSSLSTDDERLRVLDQHGYVVDPDAGELAYHVRSLDDLLDPVLPDGYHLRTVEHGDLARRVEVHRVAWDPSRVTEESYARVMETWPYRGCLDCVVEASDGSFAASALAWLDPDNQVGELEPVGTHPEHRRRGLAGAVCLFALHRLLEQGATRAIVYSRADSPAQALYRSIGFHEHARSLTLVKRR